MGLPMPDEARLNDMGAGLVSASVGWFVMNARDVGWFEKPGQGHSLPLAALSPADEREQAPVHGRPTRSTPAGVDVWGGAEAAGSAAL